MKIQHIIPLLLLLGCCAVSAQTTNAFTNTNTPPSSRAIDLIQVGKDTTWTNGYVLHIDKRDGSLIEGVRLVSKTPNGQEEIWTASRGFVGEFDHNDPNIVSVALDSPAVQVGKEQFAPMMDQFFCVVLRK